MKQVIVMVAMVALGLAIAGLIMGFEDVASDLADDTKTKITYSIIAGE
ncbi:MAG: hypothetical protein WC977_12120 [Anaerovoracaceae bacterium]